MLAGLLYCTGYVLTVTLRDTRGVQVSQLSGKTKDVAGMILIRLLTEMSESDGGI